MEKDPRSICKSVWDGETRRVKGSKISVRLTEQDIGLELFLS